MLIYLKITIALAASALLIESNALLGRAGFGNFVMAFVHAGFLLAGALYIVSAAEKYILRQKIGNYRKSARAAKSRKSLRQIQPVYNAMKIVR
jgi:hypothetical protein